MHAISCLTTGAIADFLPGTSGWFNQKMGYTYVNLQAYERNIANVTTWCATNPGELVMTGLQRATAK